MIPSPGSLLLKGPFAAARPQIPEEQGGIDGTFVAYGIPGPGSNVNFHPRTCVGTSSGYEFPMEGGFTTGCQLGSPCCQGAFSPHGGRGPSGVPSQGHQAMSCGSQQLLGVPRALRLQLTTLAFPLALRSQPLVISWAAQQYM